MRGPTTSKAAILAADFSLVPGGRLLGARLFRRRLSRGWLRLHLLAPRSHGGGLAPDTGATALDDTLDLAPCCLMSPLARPWRPLTRSRRLPVRRPVVFLAPFTDGCRG